MPKFTTITDGVEMISGIFGNQYLVWGHETITLIDAGVTGNFVPVDHVLVKLGRTPGELERILITHADPDHYAAAMEIASLSGAMIYASQEEAEAIRAGKFSRPLTPGPLEAIAYRIIAPFLHTAPVPVHEILNPGDKIAGLTVIASPGHTPGHVSFYLPEQKVLFAGDSIQIVRGKPAPSSGGNTWDADLARLSFRSQMELWPELEHLCCGHGYLRLKGSYFE